MRWMLLTVALAIAGCQTAPTPLTWTIDPPPGETTQLNGYLVQRCSLVATLCSSVDPEERWQFIDTRYPQTLERGMNFIEPLFSVVRVEGVLDDGVFYVTRVLDSTELSSDAVMALQRKGWLTNI